MSNQTAYIHRHETDQPQSMYRYFWTLSPDRPVYDAANPPFELFKTAREAMDDAAKHPDVSMVGDAASCDKLFQNG